MILCAGMGTRLLPITEKTPKPIVPVLNVANLLHSVFLFKQAGITDIIVNTYHLGDSIAAYLGDGKKYGVKINYSKETTLLGTGGGIKFAEKFFDGETFVVANCDFISNIDIAPVIEKHLARKALATMVLLKDPARQAVYSKVGTTKNGELCSMPKLETKAPENIGIFTGIHVLAPETLTLLKPEPSGVNDVLYPQLMKKSPERVFGDFVEGFYWFDTGELETLWSTTLNLLKILDTPASDHLRACLRELGNYTEVSQGVWLPRGESLPKEVHLHPPVLIGSHCNIEPNVTLGPSAIIGDEAKIESGAQVSKTVVLPQGFVGTHQTVENVIVSGPHRLTIKK